ncbi:MAG TPA: glycosyltransferase family 39 protein [Dongiaceae bacterium]|nr:glycosyltransferase family 39 protein [Dongiaceae bacterium]
MNERPATIPVDSSETSPGPGDSAQTGSLFPLIIILFGLIAGFHLGCALAGKSVIRALHLGTALEYARGPINLLRPVVVGFNATGTPTAEELPLWQAAAGLVFKVTGSRWYGWANVVSLVVFASGLWPFWRLARQYVGSRAAGWSTVFLLAQPLIVVMAGKAGTDGFSLVVSLWFLFFADQLSRTGRLAWWWPTALCASISAVTKLPFFMAAGLCSAFLLSSQRPRSWPPWLALAGAGAVAGAAFLVWTHHTNSLAAEAEFPYYELRLSHSRHAILWFFGDLPYRLAPAHWIKGGWRFLHATLGSMPLAALAAAAFFSPAARLPRLWLLATFLTTLVFVQLVLEHWHYFLMCCPPMALLCGITLARWEPFWSSQMPRAPLRLALAGTALVLSALDGFIAMKAALEFDYFPRQASALIRQYTRPEDRIIICGEANWGGEELFRAGRRGLSVFSFAPTPLAPMKGLGDLLGSEKDLQRLRSLGYNKLVLLSESPVYWAVQAVNPGSQRQRLFYPASISPVVDAWPVLYRSEDLLIKEIPPAGTP